MTHRSFSVILSSHIGNPPQFASVMTGWGGGGGGGVRISDCFVRAVVFFLNVIVVSEHNTQSSALMCVCVWGGGGFPQDNMS